MKERAASAPRQLLRRGLDDGTERLRGQFRDTSQREQRDDYGGDQIEDAAWSGARRAERGIEKLLKKKRSGRDRGPEAEPVSFADFPEAESPPDTPALADPPRQEAGESLRGSRPGRPLLDSMKLRKRLPGNGPNIPRL